MRKPDDTREASKKKKIEKAGGSEGGRMHANARRNFKGLTRRDRESQKNGLIDDSS